MNEQAIQEQYQHIVTLLKQQRLKEAQSQLEAFLWNSGDWTLRNRLEQAQTSYQYMLQYMRQGIDDPERQKLYRQILTETWEVADQARLSLLDGVSTHYYHSLRNNRERLPKEYNIAALQKVLESFPDDLAVCQLMPDNQGMDAVLQRHEQTAQVLFLSTWSNSDWSAEDEQQAKGLLESEMLPVNDLCLFTSAVMLSLMECFDTRKFSWLLDDDIVCMHTVNCDLIRFFRKCSVKQAGKIHVIVFRINADGSLCLAVVVVIFLLISEEVLIYFYRNFCKIRIV